MLKTGPVFIGPVLAFEVTIELVEKTNQDAGKVNLEELKKNSLCFRERRTFIWKLVPHRSATGSEICSIPMSTGCQKCGFGYQTVIRNFKH
jgi:hypothetical protein